MTNWNDETKQIKSKDKKKSGSKQWKKIQKASKAVDNFAEGGKEAAAKFKRETVVNEADSEAAYKTFILESIRKCFELSFVEGKPTINVDNIWPILKLLQIDKKDEKIIDLVREAGIETFGDIDASDFDKLVLELVERDAIVENKALWEQINREEKEKEEKEKIEKEKAKKYKKQLKNGDDEIDNEDEENVEDDEEKEVVKKKKIHGPESITRRAFRFIDADDDGYISVADIYQLMMGLGEMLTDDELASMFRVVDLNKDGRITFEDFDMFLNGPRALIEQDMDKGVQSKELEVTEVIDVANLETVEKTADSKPEQTHASAEEEEEAITKRKRKSVLWGYMTTTSQVVTIVKKLSSDALINGVALINNTIQNELEPIQQEHNQSENDLQINSGEEVNDNALREEDVVPIDFGFQPSETTGNTETEGAPQMRRKFTAEEMNNAPIKKRKNRWIVCDSLSNDAITKPRKETTSQPLKAAGDDKEVPGGNKPDAVSESKLKKEAREQTTDNPESKINEEAREEETHDNILDSSFEDEVFQDGDVINEHEDPDKMEVIINRGNDRVENFVAEHSYIEISPTILDELLKTPEELESVERRIKRAEMLQHSIIRRTNTEPLININISNPQKAQSARPQSETVPCSQIQFDLDLRDNIPPKASVLRSRKTSKFIKGRSTSAVPSVQIQKPIKADNVKNVNVLDITKTRESDMSNVKHEHSYNWPRRNSVRPRSALSLMNRQTFERTASLETTDEEETLHKKRPRTPSSPFPFHHQCKSPRIETQNGCSLLDINGDCILEGVNLTKRPTTKHHYRFNNKWPRMGMIHMIENKSPTRLNSISRKLEREGIPYRRDSYDISPCRRDTSPSPIRRETPDIQFDKSMFRREHTDSSLFRKNTQSPFLQMECSLSREGTCSSFFDGITACRSETSTPKTTVIQLELPPDIRKKPKIRNFKNLHGFMPTAYTVR
ncbi:hypothetical protein ACJMK2_003891 [Sinanodonta woodiana]|uniref:Sulfhydryl light chain n=1 Tax=Sinanodonta woodiana TaxID=1069815 RepID=A0ABD3XZK3_SINWO